MDNDGLTQYMRIAISVAERIAAGELREGEKISGRSKLSSEYEVSPETVRRAIQLLSDMRVVAVKEQSGVYVLSADNAKRYLQNFENRADLMSKRRKLRELIEEKEMEQCLAKAKSPEEWIEQMTEIVDQNGKRVEMDNNTCIAVWSRKKGLFGW